MPINNAKNIFMRVLHVDALRQESQIGVLQILLSKRRWPMIIDVPSARFYFEVMKTLACRGNGPFSIGVIIFTVMILCQWSGRGAPAAPLVKGVEWQPLAAQVGRLFDALEYLGSPVSQEIKSEFEELQQGKGDEKAVERVQKLLDPLCLLLVEINPESRVKVAKGVAAPELVEQGWRQFLVKVQNEAGVTAPLKAESPNAQKLAGSPEGQILNRWLDMMMFDQQPLPPTLSGLRLEYRIIQLYSRDAGKRDATISFNVGQGTQDLGFRNDAPILFTCQAAQPLTLRVHDENGEPTTAAFIVRDKSGHVYPSPNKRLAPDFAFHPQVYRGDGETIRLPDGTYTVEFSRGPESIIETRTITMKEEPQAASFQVKRWIDPSKYGWWSGDHHIHAAGCAHYTKPTEGVAAADMMRHCMGEDLKVGCNLTWGPCFDYQKQFFCGNIDKVSQYPYLLRYDVEVSGFGSHQSGHLCLLRLKEEIYPGGDSMNHWPTLGLNTLRWAKKQGAVVGPAHSGWGLTVNGEDLPNYHVPPFDGIGANEYIVDVTHEIPGPEGKPVPAVDFMSLVDTPYTWEINMWYQTLNVGFRTRGSGETDFPCIFGERVGLGRSYVKLKGKLDFDAWCEGIRNGANYVSDGHSHLMDFKVNDAAVGQNKSELALVEPQTVHATAKVAALLDEKPMNKHWQPNQKPYWHIERARIGDTREVPVELIVNGYPVEKRNIVADGSMTEVSFDTKIERSSWVAMRILASSHTNPIWVMVGGKPLVPSHRSVEWCLKGVDKCWSQKKRTIKAAEMEDAEKAYEHARETYRAMLAKANVE
jgi:hypothetical protein